MGSYSYVLHATVGFLVPCSSKE